MRTVTNSLRHSAVKCWNNKVDIGLHANNAGSKKALFASEMQLSKSRLQRMNAAVHDSTAEPLMSSTKNSAPLMGAMAYGTAYRQN